MAPPLHDSCKWLSTRSLHLAKAFAGHVALEQYLSTQREAYYILSSLMTSENTAIKLGTIMH